MSIGRIVLAGVALIAIGGPSRAQQATVADRNAIITVHYGTVLEAENVKLKGTGAGKGAVLGGIFGLAAGHNASGKNQRTSAAAGAALGAVIARAAEGSHKAEAFTVRMTGGDVIKIIQDHGDIRAGDCVAVEQGRTSNVRRVAPELCGDTSLHADETVKEHHSDQAEACHQAKEEFLAAGDQESLALAEKKIKVLCH